MKLTQLWVGALTVPCFVPQYHWKMPVVAEVPVTRGLRTPTPNACAAWSWGQLRAKPS